MKTRGTSLASCGMCGPPRRRQRLAALLLTSISLITLAESCSPAWRYAAGGAAILTTFPSSRWNRAYRTTYRPPPDSSVVRLEPDTYLGFLEADEFGWFRDPRQARGLLAVIDSLSATRNTAVVLYVHGWRHNASRGDPDARAFAATVRHLGRVLNCRQEFRDLRSQATHGDPSITIIGVYVGWRAQVWPEVGRTWSKPWAWLSNAINLPVYFTTFSRKGVSNTVGQGDVRNFIGILSDMYKRAEDRLLHSSPQDPTRRHLMSLVMIGHSYGGHLLFDAVRQQIEDNLSRALAQGVIHPNDQRTASLYPDREHAAIDSCAVFVRGVGDLVVLINPAIEAASYRRIDELIKDTHFQADQVPVLLTVSAENDAARKGLFSFMSRAERFGEPTLNNNQSALIHQALGVSESQVTHRITLSPDNPETRRRAEREVLDDAGELARRECDSTSESALSSLTAKLLTRPIGVGMVYRNIEITPTAARDVSKPALVAVASQHVINSHSDFFRVEFIDWLSEYVLGIESRKLKNILDDAKRAPSQKRTTAW